MTADATCYERCINLRHGFMSEYYVDDAEFVVNVPRGLKGVGVLLEPLTVVALLTRLVKRLENHCELFDNPAASVAIKVFCEVASRACPCRA